MPTGTPPDFVPGTQELQEHLPFWWATDISGGALASMLVAAGALLDEVAWLFELPFLNSVLATAEEEGLLRNFAFAYGLEDEQLPPTTERLREYIEACAQMDGSLQGLIRILMAIIGANAAINSKGGTVLTFPAITNLLSNPGFEEATVAPWTAAATYFIVAGATLTIETTEKHSGSHSGKVVSPGFESFKGISQTPTATFYAGAPVTFSVWMKSSSGSTGIQLSAGLFGDFAQKSVTITGSWAQYTLTWTPTETHVNTAIFAIDIPAAAAATFFVDDAAVETEGLAFPANGEGLPLYQFAPGGGPTAGLFFPLNGEGLRFPTLPSLLPSENMIGATGGIPIGAGEGLTFAQNEYLLISTPSPYQLKVEVLNWLTFDRNAFRRAIERYEPADCLPAVIQEVSTL